MGRFNTFSVDVNKKIFRYLSIASIFIILISCSKIESVDKNVHTGADLLVSQNLSLIENKRLGIITNHTGILRNGTHLVDTLFSLPSIKISSLFGPEHGIRGDAPDGRTIQDGNDSKTGLPVYSLYGKTRKPTKEMLADIDILLFDIQDIGARFYTFISTMYYGIQAAAENNIPIIILDRPNPIGGNIVEGPVLLEEFTSFVGISEIPIRHGMTVGELAIYFNQKNILGTEVIADLQIIKMQNWDRSSYFDETNFPWLPPSPNMPDLETALVYPGLCLLEGTNISEGRGTSAPFLQFGSPFINSQDVIDQLTHLGIEGCELKAIEFTPIAIPKKSMHPKYLGEKCNGIKISLTDRKKFKAIEFSIKLIYVFNKLYKQNFTFNEGRIDKLWGNDKLREQIIDGKSPDFIISYFQNDLEKFRTIRQNFLLY
ncbi:MAG: DUF1343 domain-containing protein [Melioribacteraceae bacterium]|nr:DUF1343 domain-containing protein [Melioribacteraceae bacterium]